MIQLETEYSIDGGPGTIIFHQDKDGSILGFYQKLKGNQRGVIKATLQENTLKGVFHNETVNASGLVELTFKENGFEGTWKIGMESGTQRGKWKGILSSDPNALRFSVPEKIVSLLEEQLIKPEGGLYPVYEDLKRYFLEQNTQNFEKANSKTALSIADLVGDFADLKKEDIRTVGIDFPILLKKGKDRPLLMVCALDPRRDKSSETASLISDWVPFSTIKNPDTETKYSEKENLRFFHTLLETYDLYITDIFKVFYRKGDKLSNSDSSYTSKDVHKQLLDQEIKEVKPNAILTLGNKSRDAICSIFNVTAPAWSENPELIQLGDKKTLLCLPHISSAANGTKAPILNNEVYAELEGKGNTLYANIAKKILENA